MPDWQVRVQVTYAELSQLQWKLGYIPKQGRGSGLELQYSQGFSQTGTVA